MSSTILPAEILSHVANNTLKCPYCSTIMGIEDVSPLSKAACPTCSETITIPYCINDFWLFQHIGGGGMGKVYKAFHKNHQHALFTVKLAAQKSDPDSQKRVWLALQREAHMASQFSSHPNCSNLITHGWWDEQYYMVTEYIRGETIAHYTSRQKVIPEITGINYTLALISALKFITAKGYLFRDIKPENILIDKAGRLILFDYGLCMPVHIAKQDQGMVVDASPIYVPPERLTGEGEDVRSEIYSLGLVLYQTLVGIPFFTAKQSTQLLKQHISNFRLSDEVTKMGQLPSDMQGIIARMIKRDPKDRYPDLDSLEVDLRAAIEQRKKEENAI